MTDWSNQPAARYTVTIGDVYGTNTPVIPGGCELTGEFRPVEAGEYFVAKNHKNGTLVKASERISVPRLILRKVQYWAPINSPPASTDSAQRDVDIVVRHFVDRGGQKFSIERPATFSEARLIQAVRLAYGVWPRIPEGWRATDFRVAESGEYYLLVGGGPQVAPGPYSWAPRIILEKA